MKKARSLKPYACRCNVFQDLRVKRTSHFRVSPHQFVSGGVKGVDTEHEEGLISEAVCLSLQGLDLVVGSFQVVR